MRVTDLNPINCYQCDTTSGDNIKQHSIWDIPTVLQYSTQLIFILTLESRSCLVIKPHLSMCQELVSSIASPSKNLSQRQNATRLINIRKRKI